MIFISNHNKVAVSFKDKNYTYTDIIKMAKIYSSKLDIEKEDRVSIFMENRPEYIGTILGVWDKKGTCTNLDASSSKEQIAYVFNDSNPKYIFVSKQTIEVAKQAKEMTGIDIKIILIDDIDLSEDIKIDKYEIESLDNESIAVMLYTSGTTGEPKGVMLSFGNLMSNIDAIKQIELVNGDDRLLAILPFHHVLPLVLSMLMPLHYGCLIVILDELSSDAIRKNLQEHKISVVIGVPRVWEMFHKGIMGKIKASNLTYKLFKICKRLNNKFVSKIIFKKIQKAFGGHIKILVSGGAKLDKEITEDFLAFGINLIEGYGLTETSPIITFNRPENNIPGTVGVALPNVDVRLSDVDGEILVKGPNVMKGYYKKEEATKEAIDEDGWFHTGDLGRFDGDHLKIIGRKKEMIVLSNGKNINPSDIENEIMRETDIIQEIAVMEQDKHLIAIVYPNFELLESRKQLNVKEAIKWEVIDKYNINAPKYRKILDIIIVKDELPKTKLGKLRRFMLKDLAALKTLKSKKELGTEEEIVLDKKDPLVSSSKEINTIEYKAISKFIKSLHEEIEIIPESHIEIDLGLDSLDIVELISYIEKTFDIDIKEEDFIKIKTVEELCKFIREKGGNFEDKEINWKKIFDEPIELELPKSKYIGLVNLILSPVFKLYIKLKRDINKLESNSPAIYVGNHQSMLDGFALQQILPKEIARKTYIIAISIHFKERWKKYFAKNSNIILIDTNTNIKRTLQIAAKVLKDGNNLVIFPEGARTRDGEIQEFKKTFAILSKELNIPIVPFVIKGAYDLMPYGKLPKYGEMEVKILDRIYPDNKEVDKIVSETKLEIEKQL